MHVSSSTNSFLLTLATPLKRIHCCVITVSVRGLYIGKYPPLERGKYQPMSFGGKNLKRVREKGGKCKRKRKKEERKRKKGERK
jgi:hypothetical protein